MNPQSTAGRLAARTGEFQLVVSPEVTREVLTAIERPTLHTKLHRIEATPAVDRLLPIFETAVVVVPPSVPAVCRDPDDDKFVACALAGAAEYIVSEDRDILDVREYHGIRTITVAEFLRVLDEPSPRVGSAPATP